MKTSSKLFCGVGGVLLILAGIWAFVSPLKAFIALEYFCGAMLMVTGVLSIASYFSERKSGKASGWDLFNAIISVVCGIIFCFSKYNEGLFAISISITLGMWLMMMGISQCSKSMQLKKAGSHGWGFVTALGVISIICSISVFIHPIASAIGTQTFLMGFLFVIGGISLISNCFVKKA